MKHKASARRDELSSSGNDSSGDTAVGVATRRAAVSPVKGPVQEPDLGILAGLGPAGEAWVDVPRQRRKNVPARSTVALLPEHVGREVLLSWIAGGTEPVISGVIRQPIDAEREASASRLEAVVDAERIVLTGQREVVLRCGKASIVLSADGSVVIKGVRLLTSATGVHRIRGGAVQIN
jgi:hypothetical protein